MTTNPDTPDTDGEVAIRNAPTRPHTPSQVALMRGAQLSLDRFELPPSTDWEQILLSPPNDERVQPSLPEPVDQDRAQDDRAQPADPRDPTGSWAAAQAWTGYQPHSASSASLPWGIHIRGEDLDALADPLPKLLGPLLSASRHVVEADHLAFGMLLKSLELFARFDDWLLDDLRSSPGIQDATENHRLVFQASCPHPESVIDVSRFCEDEDEECLYRKRVNNMLDGDRSSPELLKEILLRPRQALQHPLCATAALEGLRWASQPDGRTIRNANLRLTAEKVLKHSSPTTFFAAHPVSLYFEKDFAWKHLAIRMRQRFGALMKHASAPTQNLRTWKYVELRQALQAQRFPQCGFVSRPAPVYLHGDGRAVRRFRHALGI